MIKKPKQIAALASLIVVAVFVATTASTAQEGHSARAVEAPDATSDGIFAEFYALEYSVSFAEAQRRLDRMADLQQVLAELREFESERLAGWGIEHREGFGGWVSLTGAEPAGLDAVSVAALHEDVNIQVGAKHRLSELLEAQRSLSKALFAARHPVSGDGAVGVSDAAEPSTPGSVGAARSPGVGSALPEVVTFLDTDMTNNAIAVGIDPALASPIGPLGSISELTFDQGAEVVADLIKPEIQVAFTIEDGRDVGDTSGSVLKTKLFNGGVAFGGCTSGFTVQSIPNPPTYEIFYGVLTAGHCGTRGPAETISRWMNGVRLPFVYGYAGPSADAQWHRIPLPKQGTYEVQNEFVCRNAGGYPNPFCKVTGKIARTGIRPATRYIQGDFVCHTGKESGMSCGEVISVTFQPMVGEPCFAASGREVPCEDTFVRMVGTYLRGCDGDSGGPVFRNGTAYGIFKGGNNADDCLSGSKRVFFSAIAEVEAFLGVQVLTSSVTLRPK